MTTFSRAMIERSRPSFDAKTFLSAIFSPSFELEVSLHPPEKDCKYYFHFLVAVQKPDHYRHHTPDRAHGIAPQSPRHGVVALPAGLGDDLGVLVPKSVYSVAKGLLLKQRGFQGC